MKYSARLHWDLRPNPLSELLQAKRLAGAEVLDLTESNPTKAGFEYPAAVLEALSNPGSLEYDPAPAGSFPARKAVTRYYAARARTVTPERILLTASTSEAYAYLFKLLADPSDEILAPRPSYPLFEFLAALESVRIVQYALLYHDGWQMDFHGLEQAITSRTRAIVLVNPNNPTGSFLKQPELEQLVELCASRNLAIISDEVFADYVFIPDSRRVDTLVDVGDIATFCMSGLSKVAALPQMKLGWIVAGGPDYRAAFDQLELIADTYLSVATPVQIGLPRLLDAGAQVRQQISRRLCDNLVFLRSQIGAESRCRILDVEGGWYATLRVPQTRSEEGWVLELLEQDDVLVQPGFFYDFDSEAFLVLSLLTDPEVFHEGVQRVLRRAG